jgi:hypothetical protein
MIKQLTGSLTRGNQRAEERGNPGLKAVDIEDTLYSIKTESGEI